MEVKARIKCSGRYAPSWVECDEHFEYWAHMDIEVKEDHDTFGSRTYSELTFSSPEELPTGWSKDNAFTKTQRYTCDMCNHALAKEAEAEQAKLKKQILSVSKAGK